MTTYRTAGVDVVAGDAASNIAYAHAMATFSARAGRIGAPLPEAEGGFANLLDMGDYFLVQTSDGVGTKMELAVRLGRYDTIGRDLLAMVADDAVCTGAEVVSISNTLDVPSIDQQMVDDLLRGLADACREQGIAMAGGEIAEVPGAVLQPVWNATVIGIVAKDRVIDARSIAPGDTVLALRERGCRSNGYSLIRHLLRESIGDDWNTQAGELLRPSTIYHHALLHLLGRFGEERRIPLKGLAHITGGGIPSKFRRILQKSGYGALLTNLWQPPTVLSNLLAVGDVPLEEAYRTFSMGNGMLAVLAPGDADRAIALLHEEGIDTQVAGAITREPTIVITTARDDLRFSVSDILKFD